MALENVPWMIGGNEAVHSAEVGRTLAFAATNGADGVILPRDLQVRQLTGGAGPAVKIMPGAACMMNRYTGASGQSYIIRNTTDATQLTIPATGGSGVTKYVIARINDPQYGGSASGPTGPYCYLDLVSSITNLNYPFVALAKLVQPANTTNITQAMLEDIREVANPREKTVVRPTPIVTSDIGLNLTVTGVNGEWFPNAHGSQTIKIPEWATRVQIENKWLSVKYANGSVATANFWTEFGPQIAPSTRQYSIQRFKADASGQARGVWIAEDDVYVDPTIRGTEQLFVMKARLLTGTGISLDASSGVSMRVRFMEVSDPSTS